MSAVTVFPLQFYRVSYSLKCLCIFRGGPARPLPWVPNLQGALRRQWNNHKYATGKLVFSTRDITLPKITCIFSTRPLKCSPALPQARNFKEYQFGDPQIISLPGCPTYLGPALILAAAAAAAAAGGAGRGVVVVVVFCQKFGLTAFCALFLSLSETYRLKNGKGHPCTGTKALYRPCGP